MKLKYWMILTCLLAMAFSGCSYFMLWHTNPVDPAYVRSSSPAGGSSSGTGGSSQAASSAAAKSDFTKMLGRWYRLSDGRWYEFLNTATNNNFITNNGFVVLYNPAGTLFRYVWSLNTNTKTLYISKGVSPELSTYAFVSNRMELTGLANVGTWTNTDPAWTSD